LQVDKTVYGGGATATVLHPVILVATVTVVILMLLLPRKKIVVPFLLLVFLGSYGQQIYISGIHLFVLRIIILAGLVRVVLGSKSGVRFVGGWNAVDKFYTAWVIFRVLSAILQTGGASGAIIYQVGDVWENLGGYVLLRFLIYDEEDVVLTLKVFAAIVVVLAITMANEKLRNQNIFGYLGALPITPERREGSIRAQGASAHSILAGVFGVTLVPMFWWLWHSGKAKITGVAGWLGSTVMMLTCASSTPLLSYLAAVLGVCFWPFRKNMRIFRWGVVIALVTCHLVMKAPVWFLIAHVDLVAGNSGYHRAMLIDQCIQHFREWWLIGTNNMDSWGIDMWDLSNQFVAEADTGGLATFICFVMVISRSFRRVGMARKVVEGNKQQEWFMWFLGVALFTHIVGYFGISYFDQTKISWCALLAMICAATTPMLAVPKAKEADGAAMLKTAPGTKPFSRPLPDARVTAPSRARRLCHEN
jgi:hypothetical protein